MISFPLFLILYIHRVRIQDARHKLFIENLRAYVQNDEDVTKSKIDLTIHRQEKQLNASHIRLETNLLRGQSV